MLAYMTSPKDVSLPMSPIGRLLNSLDDEIEFLARASALLIPALRKYLYFVLSWSFS
jgi:hypothetical protein